MGVGGRTLRARRDVIEWADRVDAFPLLPRLVRRLVAETNDQVIDLQMRSAEGVRLPGYDGRSRRAVERRSCRRE